jgi:two-component system chemotaxis response regulator CheY
VSLPRLGPSERPPNGSNKEAKPEKRDFLAKRARPSSASVGHRIPGNRVGASSRVVVKPAGRAMAAEAKRILVVEDNRPMAGVVQFVLQQAGFQVTIAVNGREACEYLQTGNFDLVVTDQQMPEMTGCELCAHMRHDDRYAQTPVILLTAKTLELELPDLTRQLGAVRMIGKPFSPSHLVKVIQEELAPVASPS